MEPLLGVEPAECEAERGNESMSGRPKPHPPLVLLHDPPAASGLMYGPGLLKPHGESSFSVNGFTTEDIACRHGGTNRCCRWSLAGVLRFAGVSKPTGVPPAPKLHGAGLSTPGREPMVKPGGEAAFTASCCGRRVGGPGGDSMLAHAGLEVEAKEIVPVGGRRTGDPSAAAAVAPVSTAGAPGQGALELDDDEGAVRVVRAGGERSSQCFTACGVPLPDVSPPLLLP